MEFDIKIRTKKFAVDIIRLVRCMPKDLAGQEIGRQLIRSGTSVGANLEEADGASSRKEFFHKVNISYKEARESRYWLELVLVAELFNNKTNIMFTETMRAEAVELSKILYSIIRGKKGQI